MSLLQESRVQVGLLAGAGFLPQAMGALIPPPDSLLTLRFPSPRMLLLMMRLKKPSPMHFLVACIVQPKHRNGLDFIKKPRLSLKLQCQLNRLLFRKKKVNSTF